MKQIIFGRGANRMAVQKYLDFGENSNSAEANIFAICR